jgi:hypothetical protein
MGVWGAIIFQPQPDLPDTFLVTSVCNAVMINFIAQLGEFWFAIISSLILTGLKLALLLKISST